MERPGNMVGTVVDEETKPFKARTLSIVTLKSIHPMFAEKVNR